MPALTEEELAAVMDPALMQPTAADDDEAALQSQLMADLERNRFAHALNGIVAYAEGKAGTDFENSEDAAWMSAQHETSSEAPTKNVTAQPALPSGMIAHAQKSDPTREGAPPKLSLRNGEEQLDDVEDADEAARESMHVADYARARLLHSGEDGAKSKVDDSNPEDEDAESIELEQATATIEDEQENASDSSEAEIDTDEDTDLCMFCNQKELEDNGTDYEIACTVCRRPAHLACATTEDTSANDSESWRCPACSQSRTSESPKGRSSKPRHSAPRLVRDLMPVSRGVMKPGAHSIFAQPLISDDEGGRALRRKRKSLSSERLPKTNKRQKKTTETPIPEKIEEDPISLSARRSSQKLGSALLPPPPTARILQHRPFHKPPPHKFILAFRLDQSKIEAILSEPPQPKRRKYLRKKQKIPILPLYQPPVPKFPALPTHHLIFPSMFGDRENETNSKPYGGILSEADAETTKSLPQMRDREIFEIARKEAEEERKKTSAKAEAEMNGLNGDGASMTNSKRTVSGPPSKIKCIQFGKHVIDTSYAAPYPEEYSHESRLFICEFCLKYLPSEFVAWRHKLKCPAKHPPGDEIYRDRSLSIWEVDGRKKTEYCQCLCLMAKLFLGSKTLYYDVDPFLFYVLTEYDEFGYHFVGYFSKEKRPASQNNVSCILVMPIHQRKGYATFLIEFSYLLTRIEGKEGSPEKPLSDMGLTAYRSYWDLTIANHLLELGSKPFSVKDIMLRTGMTADDVVHSLERLYAFVKDPVTKAYGIRYNKQLYDSIVDKYESKQFQKVRPDRLTWTPYIMGRSDAAALDAAPVTAVAQREDIVQDDKIADDSDHISPKTSEALSNHSPLDALIHPALLNDTTGHIAPGPPNTDALNGVPPSTNEMVSDEILTNGASDKGKASVEEALSGYALTHQLEKIPPMRFQIDPPIPPAMLRYAKSKRKSMTGVSRPNTSTTSKPQTMQPVRHSPRKAGSMTGSAADHESSRATTPDKGSASVRRSGRRSGLANEITNDASSGEEDEEGEEAEEEEEENDDDDNQVAIEDDEDDEEVDMKLEPPADNDIAEDNIDDESASDDEISNPFEGSSVDGDEETDVSDDPDAQVDEEDADEEDDSGEESVEGEVDIPSAVSSAVASDEEGSEGTEED